MQSPRALLLALAVLYPGAARAAAEPENSALATLDAYLAAAAPTRPEYRTELRAGGPPGTLPTGRRLARGPVLGTFTYRPKAYAELTLAERRSLLREPGFLAYLAARLARAPQLAPTPEEMLERRPLVLRLPPR